MLSLRLAAACAVFLCAGCVSYLSDVATRDETPRTAAIKTADEFLVPLNDARLICEAGGVSDEWRALLIDHGGKITEAIEAFFESAEPCVVVDGRLRDDPLVAGSCQRGSVKRIGRVVPSRMADAAIDLGLNTNEGFAIMLAAGAVRTVIENMDGGNVDGFAHDDELTAKQYRQALAPLREAHDGLAGCIVNGH